MVMAQCLSLGFNQDENQDHGHIKAKLSVNGGLMRARSLSLEVASVPCYVGLSAGFLRILVT
jgi:hypothetical protein